MNIQKCKTLLKEDYKRLPIRSKNKCKNLILNGSSVKCVDACRVERIALT